jgi:hypothetical protein
MVPQITAKVTENSVSETAPQSLTEGFSTPFSLNPTR